MKDSVYVIRYQPAKPGDSPTPDQIRELCQNGTDADCKRAGMGLWDESGLRLIPGAWYNAVPNDLVVTSISGKVERWGECKNDDTRSGFLAFGWVPKKDPT